MKRWRPAVPEMALDQPWSIRAESGLLVRSFLERWAADPKVAREEVEFHTEQAAKYNADPFADGPGYEIHGDGVAVIPFHGVVCKRLSWWGFLFGGSASTEVLKQTLTNALADRAVGSWLLHVDSPGGGVSGCAEAANAVFAARHAKPGWTLVSDWMASAALEVGSQAAKTYANSNDAVAGSIGTIFSWLDYTQMLASIGVRAVQIVSGPIKGAGSSVSSLTPVQLAYFQKWCDDLTTNFIERVARGRSMSVDAVRAIADGSCYLAKDAIANGLIDGISTLEQMVGALPAEMPAVPQILVPAPPCDDEEDDEPSGRAEGAPTELRADVAHAVAPKEEQTMSDKNTPDPKAAEGSQSDYAALIAKLSARQDALETDSKAARVEVETLKAENAELKTKLASTGSAVTTIAQDRDFERKIAEASGETGKEQRIPATGPVRDAIVKTARELHAIDPKACDTYIASLQVIGPAAGSHVRGTAPKPAGARAGAAQTAVAFPFDPYRGAWANSTDPAMQRFGEKVRWGSEQMAAGVTFKSAQDWLTAFDAAHVSNAA